MIKKNGRILAAINFMILMAALGASDSLRGIFAPAFQEHFSLNASELSFIIMVSYMGNLIFLFVGGQALDRYNRKKTAMTVIMVWIAALFLYLFTDNYFCLLIGMFLAVGTSTLLNTTVNILTPAVFLKSPGMMVNLFFFVQGTGTSVTQNLAGRAADSYQAFQAVNLILVVMGFMSLVLLWRTEIPDEGRRAGRTDKEGIRKTGKGAARKADQDQAENAVSYREIIRQQGFWLLVLIFGLYFVAEHGIMNWMVSYGTNAMGLSASMASMYLSGFYGGITAGRLLFSPVVARAGAFRSVRLFGGVGTVLFILGILCGGSSMILLSLSGLAISILYPTMVFMIRYIYPAHMLGAALGAVISTATMFDIGFNVLFGRMVDYMGYKTSFLVIPLGMAGFYICYLFFAKKYGRREVL